MAFSGRWVLGGGWESDVGPSQESNCYHASNLISALAVVRITKGSWSIFFMYQTPLAGNFKCFSSYVLSPILNLKYLIEEQFGPSVYANSTLHAL